MTERNIFEEPVVNTQRGIPGAYSLAADEYRYCGDPDCWICRERGLVPEEQEGDKSA